MINEQIHKKIEELKRSKKMLQKVIDGEKSNRKQGRSSGRIQRLQSLIDLDDKEINRLQSLLKK